MSQFKKKIYFKLKTKLKVSPLVHPSSTVHKHPPFKRSTIQYESLNYHSPLNKGGCRFVKYNLAHYFDCIK